MNTSAINPVSVPSASSSPATDPAASAAGDVSSPALFAGLLGEPSAPAADELPAASAGRRASTPALNIAVTGLPGDPATVAAQVEQSVQLADGLATDEPRLDANDLADTTGSAQEGLIPVLSIPMPTLQQAAALPPEAGLEASRGLATGKCIPSPSEALPSMPLATLPDIPMPALSPSTLPGLAQQVGIAPKTGVFGDEVPNLGDFAADIGGVSDIQVFGAPAPTAAGTRIELPAALQAPVALATPRFADEIGARVVWQAEQKLGEASIRIAPDGLGPVEIRLRLEGDRIDVGFLAPHGETRSALESALPRLRDMLHQQGLQLGQSYVGGGQSQSEGRQGQQGGADWPTGWTDGSDAEPVAGVGAEVQRWRPRSLLDAYA